MICPKISLTFGFNANLKMSLKSFKVFDTYRYSVTNN